MLHPSYSDLMRVVNSESEGDTPVVNSRYSIVMATAKRARQIIAASSESDKLNDGTVKVTAKEAAKPLSTAVKELNTGRIIILPELKEEEKEEILMISEEEEEAAEDVIETVDAEEVKPEE